MGDLFGMLADPTRRRTLEALLGHERLVGELVTELGMSQPSVSKHLRVLRSAGVVRVRPDGQRRWYSIDPAPFADVGAWIDQFRPPVATDHPSGSTQLHDTDQG